jgi:hypothetical protein
MGDFLPPEEQPAEKLDDASGTIQEIPKEWVVEGLLEADPEELDPPHGDESP